MRRILGALALLIAIAGPQDAVAAESPGEITLTTVPAAAYKLADPGRVRTESWLFNLLVVDPQGREGIRPLHADLELFSGDNLRETVSLPESTLAKKRTTSYRGTPDSLAYQRRFFTDEVFDLRFAFYGKPAAFAVDRVRITLALAVPGTGNVVKILDAPIRTYSQKTALIFPLRGPAIVSQGHFNNSGHAGHSNKFAIDVLGLNAEYGPSLSGKKGNEEYAGWGREVIAPAAGRVVYARNDVPDNSGDGEPRDVYGKLPQPLLAVAGNCVVIDHGNGEFSALMHMQQGSVTVAVGSTVKQGQPIGQLGNSGDAFGPHLHYQLQDGPELLLANSLPIKFDNLAGADLSRGSYLTPK